MFACALVPAGALAQSTTSPSANPVRVLRQEMAALQIDHALNLTQQQAQTLLPLLQKAQTDVQTLKTQWTDAQPALVAALTQAVADLKANGTISASTAQAVEAARPATAGTVRQDLKAVWQQAKQVLTADQLQALRTVKIGIGQPEGEGADAGPNSTPGKAHHHFGRRFRVMHILASNDFVSLVQARANPG